MGRPVWSLKAATKWHRHDAFCPQVEFLEQRQQPGDALISGWMTAALLGGGMNVPVAVGPARPGGDAWTVDSTAGPRHDAEAVSIVTQVQSLQAGLPDAVALRTTTGGTVAEDSAVPASFRQGEPAAPISTTAAPASGMVTSPAVARTFAPGVLPGKEAVASPGLPQALAGQTASGRHEHASPTASTLSPSGKAESAPAAALSQTIPLPQPAAQATAPTALARHPVAGRAAPTSFGRLPLTFEANQGQADSQVQFLAREPGYTLFLTRTEAVLALAPDPTTHEGSLLRLGLTGANPAAQAVGLDEQPGKVNYFHGNDPAHWQVNVPTFAQVQYQGVYPGIDLVYYGSQQQLEYDFRVAPGADPGAIQLAVTGPATPAVDAQGNLVLHTPGGDLMQHKPVIYQEGPGGRQEVAGGFLVQGTQVRFAVGAYDASRPLVIDPVLSYSTYLGGSGDDSGNAVRVDGAGNVYLAGSTTSANFPTLNPFQSTYHGGGLDEAFVTKLNPTGTALIYSTYLGGESSDDANALAVDAAGNAYITGSTASLTFPVTAGALQRNSGGAEEAFVTKLNPTGSGLVYSTYLGGTDDDAGAGIAVDGAGNAYVTGDTASVDFPTTASAYLRSQLGFDSALLTKINAAGTALLYSTYLGAGVNPDDTGGNSSAAAIALDGAGNAYLTGETDSMSFPVTAGAFQRTFGGGVDAFVSKLNPSQSGSASLVYSSFLAGAGGDYGAAIAVDAGGNAYVVGTTESLDFPTANAFQPANGGGDADAFVTKVNAAGTALVYSTYLGGLREDDALAVAVDAAGAAYVAGTTDSTNFPTRNAIQATRRGSFDAWVTKFSPAGTALVYSTYLGGTSDDGASALAVDPSLNVYLTGYTGSTNYPTTPGAYQGRLGGTDNAFVTKVSDTHFRVTASAASVAAGTPFSVTVTALDADENPTPGYRGTVHFTSSDGRATLPAAYTFTAADNGVHTFTNGVTLVTAGGQTLSVTDGALSGSTPVTVQPGPARTLELTGVPSSVTAGMAFSVTVTARDQYNNAATGYQGTISFGSTDAGASLPASYTFTAADRGVHTFDSAVTLITAGTQTLSVTDGTLNAGAATAVQPGPAVTLQLFGVPSSVVAGTPFQVTVTALDAYDNVATGYTGTVSFSSTDGGATLPAAYTFTAADGGVHTFDDAVTLVTAGGQALTAADDTLSTTVGVGVTPAPAVAFVLSVPSDVTSGMAFDGTLTAVDPYGNTDVNYTGTVSFSSSDPDPGVVLPASYTFSAADQGSVFFPGGFTLITPGLQTITADDGTGVTGSASVAVAAGGSPNVAGGQQPRRGASADAVLVAGWPTLRASPPAAGPIAHATIPAVTFGPTPHVGSASQGERVDHYLALPLLARNAVSDRRHDEDFPDLLPNILAGILTSA